MLLLATVALIMPAIFQLVSGGGLPEPDRARRGVSADLKTLSVGVAVILLGSYAAGLLFSLKTHKDLFNPSHDEEDHGGEPWTVRRSVLMLAGAGVAVGVMSEILVSSITEASESLGLSPFFVGVIVVAVVGNAAEHWVAVYFALKNKIGLAVNIAVGSAAQIALFVAPVLVLASFVIGPFPMALVFNGFEDRRDLPRGPHRGRDHPTRRVHVVRRPATARHLCRAGADVLLRVSARTPRCLVTGVHFSLTQGDSAHSLQRCIVSPTYVPHAGSRHGTDPPRRRPAGRGLDQDGVERPQRLSLHPAGHQAARPGCD